MAYGISAYLLSNIRVCFLSALAFFVGSSVLMISAEVSRATEVNIALTIINLFAIILAGNVTAYRREVYNRRIYWMKHQVDKNFENNPNAYAAFNQLLVPNTESYTSLDDIRKIEQMQLGTSSFLQEPWKYIKIKFLLLHEEPRVDLEFDKFLAVQSLGQTRITLWVLAINMIIGMVFERLSKDLNAIDLVLRGVAVPLILMIVSLIRSYWNGKYPRYSQFVAMAAVFAILIIYLIIVGLKSSNEAGWPTDDNIAVRIGQVAIISYSTFGFRFNKYLMIALVYFFVSIPLQVYFKMASNSYIIGCNGCFFATCMFAHYYERLLFVYFTLNQITSKHKPAPRQLRGIPAVVETREVEA